MSFGGFGNTSSTFGSGGGFGSTNTGGFGSTQTTSSGGLFGANTATAGGFGSGGGGFGGTNTNNTSGGGLFGANTSTGGGFGSGGSGFGATNTASTGFGANNTSGGGKDTMKLKPSQGSQSSSHLGATKTNGVAGLFGANKPAGGFGSTNTGSIFGGNTNATSTGFGAANNTTSAFGGGASGSGGFGATNNSTGGFGGFGASNTAQTNNGTAGTPFQAFQEKDTATSQTSHFQSITFQQPYQSKSFEELRVEDYLQGRRYGNSNGQAGSFGTSTGFGGSLFGSNNNTAPTSGSSLFGGNTSTANNTSTGFGGFGATNSNNNTSTNTAFGANNTGGGLFGSQNKPAGGLFGGSTTATTGGFGSTNNTAGGGLFGANNTSTNTGFGATNNTSSGGGLFGANNNTAAKPAFGGFGQPATNASGFGSTTNNTSGGLFGSNSNTSTNTGGGLFGSNNTNNAQQSNNPFGGSGNTGGLFGNNNQAKPATGGLFGSNASAAGTSGGLFGANNNQQQQQQSGGLFGSTSNNNTSGGLFGNNNQNKPATGGLFGSTPANNSTGGGLFGNNTSTNNTGTSLFGSTNNNAAGNSLFGNNNKPAGSLFGGTNNNSGSSLFGGGLGNNNNTQQATGGSSMFGSGNQQSNNNNNNNSLFGSMNQSTNANQQNQLHASLTLSPYGNDQLFSSLGQSSTPVGPLATPLTGARPTPAKTPSLLSSSRLNSPMYTPRASTMGRTGGYGFSYSTYGTPGSAYSVSLTPQASSLLKPTGSLGSALTSRLAKSMSMNNLRGDTPSRDGDSLLRPAPGSASSRYLNSGSMRKLTIDRNLRTDLFSPPTSSNLQRIESAADQQSPGLAKKVSFDNSAAAGARQTDATPNASNALVRTETEDEAESPRVTRSQTKANNAPEMEQVNGAKSLTDIPEDTEPHRSASAPSTKKTAEKPPLQGIHIGAYFTEPRIKDLKNMSRTQLSKLKTFTVGREGIGKIEFRNNGKGIDLTNVDLDKLFDPNDIEEQEGDDPKAIIRLKVRSATVYPKESEKPARGQALNVPSRIYLENSWPRSHGGKKAVLARSGPAYEKHVKRFRNVEGTKFVNYDADTGTWIFDVDHFTTYGIDEDDDDETETMEDVQQDSSELSDPPTTLPREHQDDTLQSFESGNNGEVDDTFEFKLNRSKSSMRSSHIPGGFEEEASRHISDGYDTGSPAEDTEDFNMSGALAQQAEEDVFAAQGGAVQAPSPAALERYGSSMALDHPGADDFAESAQAESDSEPEQQLPGSFNAEEPKLLRSILKPTAPRSRTFASPEKFANDSWEEQLQRTLSPRKRDRQALKDMQRNLLRYDGHVLAESPFKRSMLGQSALGQSYLAQKSAKKVGFGNTPGGKQDLGKSQAFKTSMDLMNSLWAQEKPATRGATGVKGFENPYPKKPRHSAAHELDEIDAAFHDSLRPNFANNGTFVYAVPGSTPEVGGPLEPAMRPLVGERTEVRFARFAPNSELNMETLSLQKQLTIIESIDGFPTARPDSAHVDFARLAEKSSDAESVVWRLSALLFESIRTSANYLVTGMSDEQILTFEPRLRKDAVQDFWAGIVEATSTEGAAAAKSAEEKALFLLTRGDHIAAAEVLAKARDFRLAALVAQLPGSENSRDLIKKQIEIWRNHNDWSEMSDSVRTLYSILAGEVCTVAGKNGAKEDRVKELSISERFELNWTQSFALRLFFGGYDTLDQVVKAYADDIDTGRELTLPTPFWTVQGASEASVAGREDTLFGLLRLFSTTRAYPADLASLFDPTTVSGLPADSRLAWQLAIILYAKGRADYIDHTVLDRITRDFAAELEYAHKFVTAVWVLLHLTNAKQREFMIREVLMRNGGKIPDPSTGDEMTETNVFDQLTTYLKIPGNLLFEAKALHAKAELNNPALQARHLLLADLFDEAHEVLVSTIGPTAVIEEEYDELIDVLRRFPEHGDGVQGWERGGAVYSDFALIVNMSPGRKNGHEGKQVMRRLKRGLEAMNNADRKLTLEERVSMIEMGRILAEEASEVDVADMIAAVDVHAESNGTSLFERYQTAMGIVV
ncbi:hypothetical protein CERZMDRAFT_110901 [Cercospora zeae-maydis SCOH1-5]|uniref:Peptidase S59 domain-containing protein n=1 Tax=Cercospora zeae-maydis SCOH1-5 TaxID=717836 RepID=A0A6A6FKE0_9PEZI|nr:hypothetical protein CERZMDRAFT_110901 [Cercospora zeae-maydis SCOH1-5]